MATMVRKDRDRMELPELFRGFFGGADWDPLHMLSGGVRLEEFQEGDQLVIRSELPGVDPEKEVELVVSDGLLQIAARREARNEQREGNQYRSEFRYGSFFRTVPLPLGAKKDDIKASYRDGILEIRIPLAEDAQSGNKRIPVKRG